MKREASSVNVEHIMWNTFFLSTISVLVAMGLVWAYFKSGDDE